jgi:hypothetical protein
VVYNLENYYVICILQYFVEFIFLTNFIMFFKKVHNLENNYVICILQYFIEFIFLTNFIMSSFLNLKSF